MVLGHIERHSVGTDLSRSHTIYLDECDKLVPYEGYFHVLYLKGEE